MMKLMVILAFYSANQMGNIIVSFNIYSFIFEYRTPKIDPNLPHWITCILGVLIPFFITFSTHSLDKLFASSSFGPNIVEHVTGLQGERLVFYKIEIFYTKKKYFLQSHLQRFDAWIFLHLTSVGFIHFHLSSCLPNFESSRRFGI